MGSKDQLKEIIKLARQGKFDGDTGMKVKVNEAVKMSLDIDYNEKPYFRPALWEATWKNHENVVKFLAEKGASIETPDYEQRTPLHEAAFYGHINLVEFFLNKGAKIDPLDCYNQTPLFRAVEAGRDDVVDLLIKRNAQTNLLDIDDVTIEHCAAFEGMPDMSKWLLYKGAWKNRFAIDESTKPRDEGKDNVAEGEAPAASEPASPKP